MTVLRKTFLYLLLLAVGAGGLQGCTSSPDPGLGMQAAGPAGGLAAAPGVFNKWTARGPYPDSFSPFSHSAGVNYGGPDSGRTVQGDLDLMVQTDGFRMLHLFHLFDGTSFAVDPDMKAVLDYAAAQNPPLEILLGTRNDLVTATFQTPAGAAQYVAALGPYLSTGVIKALVLGNEPNDKHQANIPPATWATAARNVRAALDGAGYQALPVSVALKFDGLTSYPPASATFQDTPGSYSLHDYIAAVNGLGTRPFVFINLYPIFAVTGVVNGDPPLASWYPQFGLFTSTEDPASHDGNLAPYWALMDLQYNALVHAMDQANLDHVQVYVGETGWPSDGGGTYSTEANEATYVNNLLSLWVHPQVAADGKCVPTFLFEAFDEQAKDGMEAHFGLRDPAGILKPNIVLPAWISN